MTKHDSVPHFKGMNYVWELFSIKPLKKAKPDQGEWNGGGGRGALLSHEAVCCLVLYRTLVQRSLNSWSMIAPAQGIHVLVGIRVGPDASGGRGVGASGDHSGEVSRQLLSA